MRSAFITTSPLRMTTKIVAEATHFINTIKPYKHLIRLWAAVDVEDPTYCGKLDKATLTNRVRKFMSLVKSAGFETMLYTNPNYIQFKFIHNAFDREQHLARSLGRFKTVRH